MEIFRSHTLLYLLSFLLLAYFELVTWFHIEQSRWTYLYLVLPSFTTH